MTVATKRRPADHKYEFGLSDEVPSAVTKTDKARAEKAWQARSDAAAAAVVVPKAPYRIVGDPAAGRWFVEEAQVIRSPQPSEWGSGFGDFYRYEMLRMMAYSSGSKPPEPDYAPYIEKLTADVPTAELQWVRVGKKRKGFFTYADAHEWLQGYLEPVVEEPVYFTKAGEQYRY